MQFDRVVLGGNLATVLGASPGKMGETPKCFGFTGRSPPKRRFYLAKPPKASVLLGEAQKNNNKAPPSIFRDQAGTGEALELQVLLTGLHVGNSPLAIDEVEGAGHASPPHCRLDVRGPCVQLVAGDALDA